MYVERISMAIWSTALVQRRRAQRFAENARAWYEDCQIILSTCGDALYDQNVGSIDLHAVFGRIDDMLRFGLREQIPIVRRVLRRGNPDLARRFREASTKVISLRNETLRFLLHCQAPGPFPTNGSAAGIPQQVAHYRALDEVGFAARQLTEEVNGELQSTWAEVRGLVIQAERVPAT
jgi:hypothetical protein